MNKRPQRIERLKDVEREFSVARLAIPELADAVLKAPKFWTITGYDSAIWTGLPRTSN